MEDRVSQNFIAPKKIRRQMRCSGRRHIAVITRQAGGQLTHFIQTIGPGTTIAPFSADQNRGQLTNIRVSRGFTYRNANQPATEFSQVKALFMGPRDSNTRCIISAVLHGHSVKERVVFNAKTSRDNGVGQRSSMCVNTASDFLQPIRPMPHGVHAGHNSQ